LVKKALIKKPRGVYPRILGSLRRIILGCPWVSKWCFGPILSGEGKVSLGASWAHLSKKRGKEFPPKFRGGKVGCQNGLVRNFPIWRVFIATINSPGRPKITKPF